MQKGLPSPDVEEAAPLVNWFSAALEDLNASGSPHSSQEASDLGGEVLGLA